MIDREQKILFIHIPKTAGTSITASLGFGREDRTHKPLRYYLAPQVSSVAASIRSGTSSSRETLRILLSRSLDTATGRCVRLTAQDLRGYFVFTVVRNPWERAVSWYRNVIRREKHRRAHGIRNEISFPEFMRTCPHSPGLRPQLYWLVDWDGRIAVETILRFEDLDRGVAQLEERLGRPLALPTMNGTAAVDWHDFYDEPTKALVAERYRREIDLFGYRFS